MRAGFNEPGKAAAGGAGGVFADRFPPKMTLYPVEFMSIWSFHGGTFKRSHIWYKKVHFWLL